MVFIGELRRRLMSAGWLFTCVTVDRRGKRKRDYSLLENILAQKVDFAVTVFCPRPVHKMLESAEVPFLVVDNETDVKSAADTFYCSFAHASEEFVARCRRTGVRRIAFFEYGDALRFFPAIEKSDLKMERVRIGLCTADGDLAAIRRHAIDATLRRFGGSSRDLPEVIFIADDYVAEGVLVALATLGVSIPEDVRLVTVSNRGRGPVSVRDLSRFEVDPLVCGRAAANGVLLRLGSAERCGDIVVESAYIDGETFPN
jgi:DNA-binding LacI/PurR family transcriptional regulator